MAEPCKPTKPGSGTRAGTDHKCLLPALLQTKAGICLSLKQANLLVFSHVGVGWMGVRERATPAWS